MTIIPSSKLPKVMMLLGSRRCVPPTEAANTISWLLQSYVEFSTSIDVRIVSQWDNSLKEIEYDHERYLHVNKGNKKFIKYLLNRLPHRSLKRLFGTSNPELVVYYLEQAFLVRKEKPDLVVVHVAYPLFRISKIVNPDIRHIYYFHSSNLAEYSSKFLRDLFDHSIGLISICQIAINEIDEKYGPLPFPARAIHNGVNIQMFNPNSVAQNKNTSRKDYQIAEGDVVLLYAGRIHPSKGIDKIFEAFLILLQKYPNLVLLIAGDEKIERSPDLDFATKLRADTEKRGKGKVRFLGWLPYSRLIQAYAAADIGVLASLDVEGNSMFLLEAMACGLPVVSTAVGGVPEIVAQNETGFLVSPHGDITNRLVYALDKLLENPKQRREMGEQAAKRVSSYFTASLMVKKFEQFLEDNSLV